jgi:hypothetical protein
MYSTRKTVSIILLASCNDSSKATVLLLYAYRSQWLPHGMPVSLLLRVNCNVRPSFYGPVATIAAGQHPHLSISGHIAICEFRTKACVLPSAGSLQQQQQGNIIIFS